MWSPHTLSVSYCYCGYCASLYNCRPFGKFDGCFIIVSYDEHSGRERNRSVEDKKALQTERERMLSSYRERRVSENTDENPKRYCLLI